MSRKLNKKLRWAIPFAVLSVSSCASVGILAGCDGCGGHVHDYQWKYEEGGTEHWKECPDDHEIEEGSRAEHIFVAGECECGAKEIVAEKKYASATGTVKLHKNGGWETDFADVIVDMGDEVTPVLDKATGKFTVSQIEVGKSYSLNIKKTGYKPYVVTVQASEENETITIGGERGIVLEYDMFGLLMGWDGELHDFSHVNDEDSYILFKENGGGKSFNVITKDSYGDVAVTYNLKYHNSKHDQHAQGIALVFEDGKHIILGFHNNSTQDGIQFKRSLWAGMGENSLESSDALLDEGEFFNQWGEHWMHFLSAEELSAIKDENGLDFVTILKDGKLFVTFNGACIFATQLPDGYADKKAQIALWSWDGGDNAVFGFGISETLPVTEAALDIDVTTPEDGTQCTVTANPQKDKYGFCEEIELTVTVPEGYKLEAITVNGVDKYNAVKDGKLTVIADRETVEVRATFVEEQNIEINLAVKGKKSGATASLAKDTEVTFSGIDTPFTVNAEGKITGIVTKGRYTVSVDGYISKEISVDASLTEIVLEYDLLENLTLKWGWGDKADLSRQNDCIIKQINGATQFVSTKDQFGNVAVSLKLLSGGQRQGVFIRFDDEYFMIQKEWDDKISWNGESDMWGKGTNALAETWTNYISSPDLENEEYVVTLVREANRIFVFINGDYYDTKIIADKYAQAKCYVGVYCVSVPADFGDQHFEITEDVSKYRKEVTITDGTADNTGGTITVSPESILLGDTVTVTVTPDETHILDAIVVSGGITPELQTDGTYTFVASQKECTVTATFAEKPETEAEATVSGIDIGNVTVTFADDTAVKFTPVNGTATVLKVKDGAIRGVLAAGEYTATVDGYYGVKVTVGEDGSFEGLADGIKFEKVIFEHNGIRENGLENYKDFLGVVADSTAAASTGEITADKRGSIYEWTVDEYKDVAISFNFRNKAKDQGLMMLVAHQKIVSVRFQNNGGNPKLQWFGDWYGSWFWGTQSAVSKFEFGNGEEHLNPLSADLLAKYNSEQGLKLTLVRKGSMLYVLVDGKLCTAHVLGKYSEADVKFGLYVIDTEGAYNLPFEIDTNVDAILNGLTANGVMGVHNVSNITATENTIAMTGAAYAELAPATVATKESLSIKIAKDKATKQGLSYRFADGKWLGFRYEPDYIQYTQDIVISVKEDTNDGMLKSWFTIHNFTDTEKTAFADGNVGLELALVRNGKDIYVMLDGEVIDKITLDAKYAEMDGVAAIFTEGGTGTAFGYEYKSGDGVVIPAVFRATASIDCTNNEYSVKLDKTLVKGGESVTLTVETDDVNNAWGKFPVAITVNGEEVDFTSVTRVSLGANRCRFTLTVENVTADTAFAVTVGAGTAVDYDVTVNDPAQGTVKCDMEAYNSTEYYWNDLCTWTITPEEGYELDKIVIGEGDDVQEITEGWTVTDGVYTFRYTVTGDIKAVVHFKAAATE